MDASEFLQCICHELRPLRIGDIGGGPMATVVPAAYWSFRSFPGTPLRFGAEHYGVLCPVDKLCGDVLSVIDNPLIGSPRGASREI